MSPVWSRLTVRSLSVTLLLTALAGGVYAGQAADAEPEADLEAIAQQQVAAQQALTERAQQTVVASRQRAAQEAVARNLLDTARAKAAKAKRVQEAKKREAAKQAAKAKAKPPAGTVPYPGPIPSSCAEYGGNRAIGCAELLKAGFGLDQMPCLDKLWKKESGWNHKARNASSGAYGIPQAYPGDKMASVGEDWRTNPATQIRWGLSYIEGRYGTPCKAWAHSQRTGWY
ncbi:MAG TPA: lytic transglycosylase domain-containing protein [Pilimelia sp.]|nr:lytic transglycosylase domain-containing protein [Pilimelia sp.]